MAKHNIWEDPADAAVVRSLANGNETVPTIVIDDIGMVNPSADEVIACSRRRPRTSFPRLRAPATESARASGRRLLRD